MSKMYSLILCLTFSWILYLALCVDLYSKSIEWVSVQNDQVILMRPDPVGREFDWDFFLCRAEYEGNNYVGKLKINRGKISCYIPANSREINKRDFQMLNSPPGVLSWVPLINSLPSNAIIGSKNANGTSNYVCRATLNDMLISGTYLENGSDSANDSCSVTLDGKVYGVSNKSDIEVLAINKYGLKFGVQQSVTANP